MTFGLKKAISTFYSKHKGSANNTGIDSSKPRSTQVTGKGDRKTNTYPSTGGSNSGHGEATKSVRFDVSCNRNVKIVPSYNTSSWPTASKDNTTTAAAAASAVAAAAAATTTTSSSRKPLLPPHDDVFRNPKAVSTNDSNNSTAHAARPFPSSSKVSEHPNAPIVASTRSKGLNHHGLSSPSSASSSMSSSKHKYLHFKPNFTCIEEPAKAIIVTRASSTGSSATVSDNSSKVQTRLPSSGGLHSRNLSYGTIYCASKGCNNPGFVDEENAPASKIDPVNLYLTTERGKGRANNTEDSSKSSNQSSRHIFGLGGRNYGHGSIISGMKTIRTIATNPESICSGESTGVESTAFCVIKGGTVGHLKAAGNEEYKRGRFSKAISLYDKALALCPNNIGCHNNKAAALAALGKVSEAVCEYLEVISLDSTYSRAYYQLGVLYTRLGQLDEARKYLKLSDHDQGSEAINRLQVIEGHMKKLERSIKVQDWSLVLAQSSHALEAGADVSHQVVAAKVEALLKLRRADEALETILAAKNREDWLQSKKTLAGALRLLLVAIQVYFYLGRFEEAVKAAEEATSIETNRESLMWLKKAWGTTEAYRAGNEYYKQGKYSKACAMYSQGLQYDPENGILLCRRAACRSKLGHWEKSVQDSNAALESYPGLQEALLQRAQAHARLGEWHKAQTDYSELIKLKPGDPTVLNSLFEMHMEIQRGKRHQIA